ncbi:MAG: hypothetical protein K0Q95_2147 [Bacteroidota bacterium]|jgi:integrase|nr:hypothetical protein [Bacteroidota bacterium]
MGITLKEEKMNYNYSIKAILRKDKTKKNGKCPINLMVTFGGKQLKLPTQLEAEEKFWDKNLLQIKKGEQDYGLKNAKLMRLKNKLQTHIYKLELSEQIVNGEAIKNFLGTSENKNSFYTYFEKQIQLWKSKKKESTLIGYSHTLSVLRKFKAEVKFIDINLLFVKEFEQYLRDVRKVGDGGAFNRQKHLRAVIREAVREKKLNESPYANGNFQIKKSENKKRFLTIEEVEQIEKATIPAKRTRLLVARDMFLFCCYTGLRYSDMQKLCWENIVNGEINIVMQKTGKQLTINLNNKASGIIEKYKNNESSFVFEKLSNQKLNVGVKKIFRLAGTSEQFTFHDSRHAFACALVARGVSLTIIRDLMGHASIKETDKYAKVDQKQKHSAILLLD